MKIYLDDVRIPSSDYTLVKSVNQAISVIEDAENRGEVIEVIDLDHDLGDYFNDGGDAIKLLDWLLERGTLYPVVFHTANPVGRANMERMVNRWWKKFK